MKTIYFVILILLANIEIREEIGDENIWLFGALANEVEDIRYNKM